MLLFIVFLDTYYSRYIPIECQYLIEYFYFNDYTISKQYCNQLDITNISMNNLDINFI